MSLRCLASAQYFKKGGLGEPFPGQNRNAIGNGVADRAQDPERYLDPAELFLQVRRGSIPLSPSLCCDVACAQCHWSLQYYPCASRSKQRGRKKETSSRVWRNRSSCTVPQCGTKAARVLARFGCPFFPAFFKRLLFVYFWSRVSPADCVTPSPRALITHRPSQPISPLRYYDTRPAVSVAPSRAGPSPLCRSRACVPRSSPSVQPRSHLDYSVASRRSPAPPFTQGRRFLASYRPHVACPILSLRSITRASSPSRRPRFHRPPTTSLQSHRGSPKLSPWSALVATRGCRLPHSLLDLPASLSALRPSPATTNRCLLSVASPLPSFTHVLFALFAGCLLFHFFASVRSRLCFL